MASRNICIVFAAAQVQIHLHHQLSAAAASANRHRPASTTQHRLREGRVLPPQPPGHAARWRVADLYAAPGGKTSQLAALAALQGQACCGFPSSSPPAQNPAPESESAHMGVAKRRHPPGGDTARLPCRSVRPIAVSCLFLSKNVPARRRRAPLPQRRSAAHALRATGGTEILALLAPAAAGHSFCCPGNQGWRRRIRLLAPDFALRSVRLRFQPFRAETVREHPGPTPNYHTRRIWRRTTT